MNAQVVADLHTSDADNVICRNDPFTLYMTPSQTIRYVFQFSENGGPWTDYTNLSSDAIVGNEVFQSNITLITNTQFRVKYTTDLSVNSVPNTIDPTVISVVVNQLPAVEPITYLTNTICQNASVTYSSITPSGVWSSSNSAIATVGATDGIVFGVSQGFTFIKYIVTDPNTGCKNQDAKRVTVNPTPIISSYNDAVCSGVSYTKIPTGFVPSGTTFNWAMPTTNAPNSGDLTGMAAAATTTQPNINALLTNTTNAAITATYSITATKGSCSSVPFNLNLTVTPKPFIADRTIPICSGVGFNDQPTNQGADIVPINTTYSWLAPNAIVGLTGQVASGTPTPTAFSGTLTNSTINTISISYTIKTYSDGCEGNTFTTTVSVKPKPTVTNKSTTICSNTSFNIPITIGSVPANTTYTWSAPVVTGINGLQAGTSTSTIAGTLSNTTNATINVDYSIRPNADGCDGSLFIARVTVDPVPVISNQGPTQIGSGSNFNFSIGGTIVPVGTTYTWSSPSMPTGLTGGVPSGTPTPTSLVGNLTNPTGGFLDALYTITPAFGACVGANFTYTVRVYPKPIVGLKQRTICSGETFTVTLTDGDAGDVIPSGTTYSWNAPVVTGITGTVSGTAVGTISGTLSNSTNNTIVVTYSVTPFADPQYGDAFNVVVTVHPLPIASINVTDNSGINPNDRIICSNENATFSAVPVVGVLTDYQYTWTVPVGVTTPSISTASFEGNKQGTYALSIKNAITGCNSAVLTSTSITVNTIPTVGTISGTVNTVCVGSTIQLEAINTVGGQLPYIYYGWFTSETSGMATTPNRFVDVRGVSAGAGNLTYSVLDNRGCMSDKSLPYDITVYDIPLPPIVTPVNVVYDGVAHQVNALPAAAPFGNDLIEWYDAATLGSSLNPIPSITNVGTLTKYAQAVNNTTGCKNLNRIPATVTITKKTLKVTANNKNKVYDAQIYSGAYDVTYDGFVNGENETSGVLTGTLSFTGGAMTAKNVGEHAIQPGGLNASNYTLNFINGTLSIARKSISITNVSVASKVYDATDNANFLTANLLGVEAADIASVQLNPILKFPSKNVGNNLTITSTSTLIGNPTIVNNYTLNPTINAFANITPKTIDASGFITVDKVYDATTKADVIGGVFRTSIAAGTGSVNDKTPYIGDVLSIQPAGYFTNQNVANTISIISTATISGTDASNYILETPVLTPRNITPKNLLMQGLSVALTKIYDATTQMAVLGSPQFFNAIAPGSGTAVDGLPYIGDIISFVGTPNGTYNSKDVLTASSVQYTGLSIGGAQANNYTLTMQSNSAATILPKRLTMSGLVVPASKVYDGSTIATVTGTPILQNPIVAGTGNTADGKPYIGDQVSITGIPLGQYNTQNVSASTVSFSGLNLSGIAAANYELEIQSSSASNITPLNRKVYAEPQVKKYGAADPIFTFTHDPLIPGDFFTGVLSREQGESIGQYAIQKGSLDLGVNYTITYFENKLTIDPVDLYIRPNTIERTYGDDPLIDGLESSDFSTIGLQFFETLGTVKLYFESGLYSGNNKKDSIGLYLNKVEARDLKTGTAILTNYNIIYQLGNLQVDKYNLRIVADDKLKRETEIDPPFTYQILNNLIAGDSLTGALTREVGITPGYYQIQQGTLAVNNNYNYIYSPAYLTILTIKNVFVVPTAFSPNNDGLNDLLSILHNPNVAGLIYFKIFNRAGNLVYQTNTLSGAWDGKVAGVMQDADAYYWMAEFVTWNNLNVKQKGTFLLIK